MSCFEEMHCEEAVKMLADGEWTGLHVGRLLHSMPGVALFRPRFVVVQNFIRFIEKSVLPKVEG